MTQTESQELKVAVFVRVATGDLDGLIVREQVAVGCMMAAREGWRCPTVVSEVRGNGISPDALSVLTTFDVVVVGGFAKFSRGSRRLREVLEVLEANDVEVFIPDASAMRSLRARTQMVNRDHVQLLRAFDALMTDRGARR